MKADDRSFGVIYVAFGWPYLVMAVNSIRSLKKTNSSRIGVYLITNCDVSVEHLPFWNRHIDVLERVVDEQGANRRYKIRSIDYSPFDTTAFLDCDTIVRSDLRCSFGFMKYWDIAFRLKPTPYPSYKRHASQPLLGGEFTYSQIPNWNGGVFLYRNTAAAKSFFENWHRRFEALSLPYDQVSLFEALFTSDARLLSLDQRWNHIGDGDERTLIQHYQFPCSREIARDLAEIECLLGGATVPNDSISTFIDARARAKMERRRSHLVAWRLKRFLASAFKLLNRRAR